MVTRRPRAVQLISSLFFTATCLLAVPATWAAEGEQSGAAFPRLRAGISFGLGGGSEGTAGALSSRAGIQWTSVFAASYQLTGAITTEHLLESGDYADWISHGLLAEITVPSTMLTVGAGPTYARGTVGRDCFLETTCSEWSTSFAGMGVDARLAYAIGINWPRRRAGGILELAGHFIRDNRVIVFSLGVDLF